MKSAKQKRKSETIFQFKCPICNKVLPQEKQQGNFLEEPLPCADCFQKFRRRRSTQSRILGRRYSDLGTIREFSTSSTIVPLGSDAKSEENCCGKYEGEDGNPIEITNGNLLLYANKEIKCCVCAKPTYVTTTTYADHLKHEHSAFGYENQQETYVFKNGTNCEGFDKDGTYKPDYFNYGGHTFLSQGCNRNGMLHGWITMCSSKDEARNYEATVVIYLPDSKVINLQWRIPVQSVEERKTDFSCSYSILWKHLRPYIQKNVRLPSGDVFKYSWNMRVSVRNFPEKRII